MATITLAEEIIRIDDIAHPSAQIEALEKLAKRLREQRNQSVLQTWVEELPLMQQTVLLTAIRGPDGLPKYGPTKLLLRWFRRCILLSAMDQRVLTDPCDSSGGSFTGPSVSPPEKNWEDPMNMLVDGYLTALDAIPHHFQLHLLHAAEIVGYKHPDERISVWWNSVYRRLVADMHLRPEPVEVMDERLGDSREQWLKHADEATKT